MREFIQLTKPRITWLILMSTGIGYFFGLPGAANWWAFLRSIPLLSLLHTIVGTGLIASGTAALNQWYEADSDAKMHRTRARPIPAGRMKRNHGFVFAVLLSTAGLVELWLGANVLTAALGLFTLLSYILAYTPLKRRSQACTTVGALPGAMPPLIGYAAASGGLDARALALFLILFVWQFPHFYAIAWMYREDYARGGIRMLPVIESDGESTAKRIVACSVLLVPVSLVPLLFGMTGLTYPIAAVVAGLGLLHFGVRLVRERTSVHARHVLLASVLYLPILLGIMVIDQQRF